MLTNSSLQLLILTIIVFGVGYFIAKRTWEENDESFFESQPNRNIPLQDFCSNISIEDCQNQKNCGICDLNGIKKCVNSSMRGPCDSFANSKVDVNNLNSSDTLYSNFGYYNNPLYWSPRIPQQDYSNGAPYFYEGNYGFNKWKKSYQPKIQPNGKFSF